MTTPTPISIVWFRQDLRLEDNPALVEAAKHGVILPVYIVDDTVGAASRWWLYESLAKLDESLSHKLHIYQGDAQEILKSLCERYPVRAVYWNRCYEPWRIAQDTVIKDDLRKRQLICESFNGSLLWEPWEILKGDKTNYKVFTPYYQNGCLKGTAPRKPLSAPSLQLVEKGHQDGWFTSRPWQAKLASHWEVGEKAAQVKLCEFLENFVQTYDNDRDFPSLDSTSKLSPHLHFGEISPQQIWHQVPNKKSVFLKELVWREFSYYLLYHFPELPHKNFQSKFDKFQWEHRTDYLEAWQKGETGVPLVDAGMKELWETGYMHNRVRMVAASFLVKNLLIDWRHGARWFWDCLVDADLANNSASWQWVAGSGADAAPYFRIFNPLTQAGRFDADESYIRRWLGDRRIKPIVDVKLSRVNALDAYKKLRAE
ncbi:MAG: deoxyribodipyrimidine photo-lyase [Myxococcota bacterium]